MSRKKIQLATEQRPFIMVYKDFLESNLLDNYYQRLVYIYLKKFADSENQCYPSVKTISKQSGISVNKVKITLKELEEKGIIEKANRSRPDGGKSSNLYTLYDYGELWNAGSSEEAAAVIDEIEEKRMIEALTAKGYYISKEKGLDTEPTKAQHQAPQNYNLDTDKDITTETKSQVEIYTLEDIKIIFEYDIMLRDNPYQQRSIDSVMDILYKTVNTTKKTIRISGEDRPSAIVIDKLKELSHSEIMYAIEKYQEQTERIKNPTSYMLTLLYHAKEQMHLDITNQVQHDMYNGNQQG